MLVSHPPFSSFLRCSSRPSVSLIPRLVTNLVARQAIDARDYRLFCSTTVISSTPLRPPFCLRARPPSPQEPPAYVIGPATHVGHALNALVGFHTNRVEATVMNVMDSAMVGALSIRRAEPVVNVLIVSQSYEVRRRVF